MSLTSAADNTWRAAITATAGTITTANGVAVIASNGSYTYPPTAGFFATGTVSATGQTGDDSATGTVSAAWPSSMT
jgi:hypothetical protein